MCLHNPDKDTTTNVNQPNDDEPTLGDTDLEAFLDNFDFNDIKTAS